jgi:NAD+ kinase
MKIGVFAKSVTDPKHRDALLNLLSNIHKRGHQIFCPPSLEDFIHMQISEQIVPHVFDYFTKGDSTIDVLISVGGDGTILDTLQIVRDSEIPVLSINTGRLGFLAGVDNGELDFALDELEKGNYFLEPRSLLHLDANQDIFDFNYGLNDFVIHKKETSSMIVVHTYLNGEFLNSYWSDGLIISTPTGSTGYSLSCGGPIIFPKSDSFVITPIAPHNLNVRPVVVSDDVVISFEIEGRASSYLASLDARSQSITQSVNMAVKKANFNLVLMRLGNLNFMDNLRGKLNWGFDKRTEM